MKIKLNVKQVSIVARELRESDRKSFDLADVAQVFKMLQYWTKVTGGGEKIQSVTELADGYLCRVNKKFHDAMKVYIKEAGSKQHSQRMKEVKVRETIEKYDRLMKEAEEQKHHPDA